MINKKWNLLIAALCSASFSLSGQISLIHSDREIHNVLEREMRAFEVHSIKNIGQGDFLVVEVNDDWIFRFPVTANFLPVLKRERLLLNQLHDELSFETPFYEFIGKKTAFVGYRKIEGNPLTTDLYLSYPEETRQNIAESIAIFFTEFHQVVSPKIALKWGFKKYKIPVKEIETDLLHIPVDELSTMVSEALVYFKEHPQDPKNLVIVHNDLHGGNFAFDVNSKKINGVFDFSDAALADYSVEFSQLFWIHKDLAIRTAGSYAAINNVPNPIFMGAVDFILRKYAHLLAWKEKGEEDRVLSQVKKLERFIPIWNEIKLYKEVRLNNQIDDGLESAE